ncbi:hypothetical protein KY290_030118 [Solanum tuberosum]|uniref:Uncharacterized protein n=1 Tax=Solanum tuberosum TaxID=4113 RepID=A0ABQ7UMN7_SOLTU|nr:hypothetical protein KY290_030118 [Solanum tuberosum]
MELHGVVLVTGSLDNRPILVRFNRYKFFNIHRDIAVTAQMSHLKIVLRLVDEKSGVAKILNFSLSISLPPGELEVLDDGDCFGILLFQLLTGKDVYDIMIRVRDTDSITTLNYIDRVKNATNLVDRYIKEDDVLDIVDLTILEEHGSEIQQQLKDYLDLARKCTADKGDDRPYIIHVARELGRIVKCFRSWSKLNV